MIFTYTQMPRYLKCLTLFPTVLCAYTCTNMNSVFQWSQLKATAGR